MIRLRGSSYTLEEADALVMKELSIGNAQAAVDICTLILAKVPNNAGVYNNRGNLLQMLGRFDEAMDSYDEAIRLNPYYADVYNNRGAIFQKARRYGDALANYDKALTLRPDYAEAHNSRGAALQAMKHYDVALASFDTAIALKPGYAEAHSNRAATLHEMRRYGEALVSYDEAVALNPNYANAYSGRGITLHALKRHEEALASFNVAIMLRPDFAEAYNNRGDTLQDLKRHDDALASFDKAITLKPDYAEALNNLGIALMNKGEMSEAERMFLKALALEPDYPAPLYNLTSLRKYRDAGHVDIEHIQALLAKPGISQQDRECLYFSLGKCYDDCGLYDEAFEYYRQANQIRNATVEYDSDEVTRFVSRVIDVFSKDFLAQPFAFLPDSRSPLFIVGMPRSGTTLMASILSNHRSIGTAGELPTINEITLGLPGLVDGGIPYPQAVKQITPVIATRLIRDYEKRLRRDAGSDVLHVIDKHPLNFRHLGLISMLFPNARVIHCTRYPLDTGLSNYFQRFSSHYDYSYDLRNIGHFYGEYARLMEHWRKALPMKMIEISYEDMITDTEPMVRRALEFLGLEWDERCLAPHTNPYAVETASNWQVRQPIYGQSVKRWRHYEKHLAPLKEVLQISGQVAAL